MASKVTKVYTGIAGLPVNQQPHKDLIFWINRIMRNITKLPPESKYRTTTEGLLKEKKALVESTDNIEVLEGKLGYQCEEVIEDLKMEYRLTEVFMKYRPWEPLDQKPPADQWKWPL